MASLDARQKFLAGLLLAFLLGILGWKLLHFWNRPPAVEFDNLKYIRLLTTAVSARNAEMVSKVEAAVQKRFDAGEMSPGEREHFQRIIALTEDSQWAAADQECFRFAEAQLNRARSQPPSEGHSHDHEGHDRPHDAANR